MPRYGRLHLKFFLRFFFNDTATTEIYTLSLHDALPISALTLRGSSFTFKWGCAHHSCASLRSEEHTSELQSPCNLVCRLLLEKRMMRSWCARVLTLTRRCAIGRPRQATKWVSSGSAVSCIWTSTSLMPCGHFFFFNAPPTAEIYTLSLQDPLPN